MNGLDLPTRVAYLWDACIAGDPNGAVSARQGPWGRIPPEFQIGGVSRPPLPPRRSGRGLYFWVAPACVNWPSNAAAMQLGMFPVRKEAKNELVVLDALRAGTLAQRHPRSRYRARRRLLPRRRL